MPSSRENRHLKFVNTVTAHSISITMNTILFILIMRHSCKLLMSYKRILLLTVLCDIANCIVGVCIQGFTGSRLPFAVTIVTNNGIYYTVAEGILGNLKPYQVDIGVSLNIFCVHLSITILPVQYIYRYLLLIHKYCLRLRYFFFLCGVATFIPLTNSVFWGIKFWPNESFKNYSNFLNNDLWLLEDGSIPGFAAAPLSELTFNLLLTLIIYIYVYSIIIYCSYKIIQMLRRSKATMSIQTHKLQSQITFILFIQASHESNFLQ